MSEPAAVVSEEALSKAEEFIEEEEGAANQFTGWRAGFITVVAVVMSVFHLYTAYAIVPTQDLRPIHVGFVLFLTLPAVPGRPALPAPDHVVGHRRGRGVDRGGGLLPSRAATTSWTATPRPCPGTSSSASR